MSFDNFLPAQDSNMIGVAKIVTASTISPISALSVMHGAGTILNITPPLTGYHELSFLLAEDLIFFDSGGNIETFGVPMSVGANNIIKLIYNPLTKKYYRLTDINP